MVDFVKEFALKYTSLVWTKRQVKMDQEHA